MTRALIYARISKDTEESVSIARQVGACTDHAKAKGYTVVGTYKDESVSATKKAPANRPAWQQLTAELRPGDVVVIWHQDRLVRSIRDWSAVVDTITEAKATLEGVTSPIDLAEPMVAQLLTVVAEDEARRTSKRIRAARRHIIENGRAFGPVPYGWRLVPGNGGKVPTHDPDRIDWVRGMVERCRTGTPTYAIVAWLNEAGAPLPAARGGGWTYSTVARLLRHPMLAGLTPTNFGYEAEAGERGPYVLRDEAGEPVVNAELAIMSVADWRAMVAALDARTGGAHTPRASRRSTSPLLAGLVWCVDCDRPMNRGRTAGRPGFKCPTTDGCGMTITRLEELVVPEFLRVMGGEPRWRVVEEVHPDGGVVLELDRRIAELGQALVKARTAEESAATLAELQAATARRDERRKELGGQEPTLRIELVDVFAQEWADADGDVDAQRAVLADALARIEVRRGGVGQHFPDNVVGRLRYVWRKPDPSAAYPPNSTTHGQRLPTDDERYGL